MAVDDPDRVRLGRQIELEPLAVLPDIPQALVEADPAIGDAGVDRALVVAQQRRARGHVLGIAAEDFLRLGQRRAALPFAGGEGIFALRERAGTEVAADQQGVLVHPLDPALALLVEHEAAFDEPLRHHVELAHDGGILAPVGERDHAAGFGGRQAGRALIDPLLALRLGERVNVENDLPLGVGGAVAFQRGPAQHALGVRLVLPEIIQAIGAEADEGDAIIAVENRQRFCLELRIARVGLEGGEGALVLLRDPVERLGAARLFEEDIGVLLGSGHAGNGSLVGGRSAGGGCDGHGESQCESGDKFQASSPQGKCRAVLCRGRTAK